MLLVVILAAAALRSQAAEPPRLHTSGNRIEAVAIDGRALWRAWSGEAVTPSVRLSGGGYVLSSGEVLDRLGRLRSATPSAIGFPATFYASMLDASAAPQWSPQVDLFGTVPAPTVSYFYTSGPAFDPQGSAYLVQLESDESGNNTFSLVASQGASGVWGTPQPFYQTTDSILDFEVIGDRTGNIWMLFRRQVEVAGAGYELDEMHWTPASGWQAPVVVYDGADFFQTIRLAVDSANDIICLIDKSGTAGTAAFAYVNSGSGWSGGTQVSNPLDIAYMQNLAANKAGDSVYLVYGNGLSRTDSLHSSHFNVATKTWSAPIAIPGSTNIREPLVISYTAPPTVVDANGVVSVLFQPGRDGSGHNVNIDATRLINGVWQQPKLLLSAKTLYSDLQNFSAAAGNAADGVLIVNDFVGTASQQTMTIFRWTGSAWATETAASFNNSTVYTPYIDWTGGNVAGVLAYTGSGAYPQSVYDDGSGWSQPTQLSPIENPFPFIMTSPTGNTLLLTYAYSSPQAAYESIVGSWLLN